MTETKKPELRGEHDISRKPLRAGMPGDFRWTRGDYARVLFTLHARLRVHWAPGIPHALLGRTIFMHDPDAIGAAGMRTLAVIARSDLSAVAQRAKAESDEAIQLSFSLRQSWIASRSLSSGARSRDPLARKDGVDGPRRHQCARLVVLIRPDKGTVHDED